mgnify:CR=1 FL=1
MAKRQETLDLENALFKQSREKRVYGCEEVTIGFHNNGHGNEVVDFITMDSKGVIKCYEIKVTLSDLKSKAKKSWYGHYNYLVISRDLLGKVDNWNEYIPDYVGIIVGTSLYSLFKAKRRDLSPEDEMMIKESMVRSMSYKIDKYKDANNLELKKQSDKMIRELKSERNKYYDRMVAAERIIHCYEKFKEKNDGVEINLEEMAHEEMKKYLKSQGRWYEDED